ncbi:MAG TPA: amino acid adenylation domain-containing protein [Gemmobacter sp.]|nr:amino acid adenylation domain-containing protein [Gemmobacter sp.]
MQGKNTGLGEAGHGHRGAQDRLTPTSLQQAMLLSGLASSGGRANLEQILLEAPDLPLEPERLHVALRDLAARHPALRARADLAPDGVPFWEFGASLSPELARCDWPEAAGDALEAWLEADRARGCDLRSGGWRAMLATRGELPPLLVLTLHHAVIDLPGMAVLLEDLADLLCAKPLAAGEAAHSVICAAPPLDEAAAQTHFAARFGEFEKIDLLDLHRTPGRMQSCRVDLPAEVTAALRSRARKAGAGTFAALQAAWALILARWTGRSDASFGLTLAGRNLMPGHERTVASLIATLPQRLDLADVRDLDALLALAQSETEALRPHHAASLDQVRQWAGLSAATPLFQTVLVYSRARLGAMMAALGKGWQNRKVQLLEEGETPATMAVYGTDVLELELEYDAARISPDLATRFLDQYAALLTAMANAPDGTPLHGLSMLSAEEQATLLRLSRPERPVAEALPCVATRFAAMVSAQPEAVAVIDETFGELTYAELDARAEVMARRLARKGIGAESIVAINLPRGADFTLAILAVLKAGAAFLPLDMGLPETERSLRAVESDVCAVIGETGLAGLAVPLISPSANIEAPPFTPLVPEADRLAYIIHTSGSTGRPKGVMGTQGALSAHASAAMEAYGLTPADRVLHFASPGFDVALEEIVPTLLSGAALVIRGEDETASFQAFLEFVARHHVTVMNLPASFWHVLVDEMKARGLPLPPSVRLVVTGSERINAGALADWQRLAPGCAWMNGYGPTEATITSTTWAAPQAQPLQDGEDVPIGRPMGHARAYVLAFDGSLAPRGAEGNLHIGGVAVTRGYLNQPEITARLFRPDPFAGTGRIYTTGDRAQWRADGALMFLGRRDRQVKLRGLRIDLGDVERALGQFEGLRDVRVAVHGAGSDAARLVAWVCGPDLREGSPALEGLVAHVARYMTGATMPMIVPVEAFPLKPNGKVDMAALPAPVPPGDQADDGPVDTLTFAVASLMAKILGVSRLGPDDDIRDYGANSLITLRIASMLEARFRQPVVTTDLYRYPTARSLARFLERDEAEAHLLVPIQPEGDKVPFFAIHVLGEKEVLFRPLSEALGPDYPVYGLTVGPPKSLDEVSVPNIARRYFNDIQLAFPEGPLALGAVSMAAYFAYELAQLLLEAGRDVRFVAVLDAQGPDGRPPVQGAGKIVAHLGQIRRHGWRHVARVLHFRRENRQIEAELASARPGEVNGANLVLANVAAVEAYQPRPIACPLLIFRADASFWDSRKALETGLGWSSVAAGGWQLIDIPGDHLSILEPQNVGALARHLMVRLG